MTRILLTIAIAGWAGYHGAWALGLVVSHASGSDLMLPGGLSLPDASRLQPAAILILSAAHAMLAATFLRSMRPARGDAAEVSILAALAGGAGLAIAGSFLGLGAGEPGTYAVCVMVTLFALYFDRMAGTDGEEEVDHAAFARRAARLGAHMGRRQGRPGERR